MVTPLYIPRQRSNDAICYAYQKSEAEGFDCPSF